LFIFSGVCNAEELDSYLSHYSTNIAWFSVEEGINTIRPTFAIGAH